MCAFRTSSTHYKDPEVSVRKSQDCGNNRNQHAPKCMFPKGKMEMMCQWQHCPVSSQDVTPSENRPSVGHEHLIELIHALYKCSINQSFNQLIYQSTNQKHIKFKELHGQNN
jgi:hypothetical protein